jgi:hypothetical protein
MHYVNEIDARHAGDKAAALRVAKLAVDVTLNFDTTLYISLVIIHTK